MNLTGAIYEPGDGPRPILTVIKADGELLALQPVPEGLAMAVTLEDGVETNTHVVTGGVVVPA
jgi:hypothetical protein